MKGMDTVYIPSQSYAVLIEDEGEVVGMKRFDIDEFSEHMSNEGMDEEAAVGYISSVLRECERVDEIKGKSRLIIYADASDSRTEEIDEAAVRNTLNLMKSLRKEYGGSDPDAFLTLLDQRTLIPKGAQAP